MSESEAATVLVSLEKVSGIELVSKKTKILSQKPFLTSPVWPAQKGEGEGEGEGEKPSNPTPPPFSPSIQSPAAFDVRYAGYFQLRSPKKVQRSERSS